MYEHETYVGNALDKKLVKQVSKFYFTINKKNYKVVTPKC